MTFKPHARPDGSTCKGSQYCDHCLHMSPNPWGYLKAGLPEGFDPWADRGRGAELSAVHPSTDAERAIFAAQAGHAAHHSHILAIAADLATKPIADDVAELQISAKPVP